MIRPQSERVWVKIQSMQDRAESPANESPIWKPRQKRETRLITQSWPSGVCKEYLFGYGKFNIEVGIMVST